MKKILSILNFLIWPMALAQAFLLFRLTNDYKSLRSMNKGTTTIYVPAKTIEASEDIGIVSDLECFEIQHFEKDSLNLILITYKK